MSIVAPRWAYNLQYAGRPPAGVSVPVVGVVAPTGITTVSVVPVG